MTVTSTETQELEQQAEAFRASVGALREQLARTVVGQREALELLVTAIFADGHVLIEGLPGLGKTLMAKALSRGLCLGFNRIQFTPDLMPADITGTTVLAAVGGDRSFSFEPGPIFTNLLLADEINRAGPKTQSALLQAMQEREVSLFGRHYPLPDPFIVCATQNPVELAGTYPLPEAQLDRFLFKAVVTPPGEEELLAIAERTTGGESAPPEACVTEGSIAAFRRLVRQVPIAAPVLRGIVRAVLATRPDDPASTPLVRRFVRHGVSPRGLQALVVAGKVHACLAGRFAVSMDDVRPFWLPALRHRIILDAGAGLEGIGPDRILQETAELLRTA
ncbi:MAG TPA: AAA family ATPase [Candidatus Methanoperedens sp.]|nr:AAA family ATPase [Candidatus Methanoperedens sp.]